MGLFGSEEKKRQKEHDRALKELAWAFKAAGIGAGDLRGIMNGTEPHVMLLTDREVIWAKQGMFGGKVLGRIPRSAVKGFKRETGWNSNVFTFITEGANLPKDNRFPSAGDSLMPNILDFLDNLSGGTLFANMTDAEREDPMGWARGIDFRIPDAPATAAPAPAEAPAGATAPTDIPDQIAKLKSLLDAGALTQEEFDVKKRQLLERM